MSGISIHQIKQPEPPQWLCIQADVQFQPYFTPNYHIIIIALLLSCCVVNLVYTALRGVVDMVLPDRLSAEPRTHPPTHPPVHPPTHPSFCTLVSVQLCIEEEKERETKTKRKRKSPRKRKKKGKVIQRINANQNSCWCLCCRTAALFLYIRFDLGGVWVFSSSSSFASWTLSVRLVCHMRSLLVHMNGCFQTYQTRIWCADYLWEALCKKKTKKPHHSNESLARNMRTK